MNSGTPHLRDFELGLAEAGRSLKAAGVKVAVASAGERAAMVVLGTGALAAAVAGVCRVTAVQPVGPVIGVLVAGLGTAAVSSIITLLQVKTPSLEQIAERFDLAAADHNAVATAIDFARSGETSPMGQRAIADGLGVLRSGMTIVPASPAARVRPWHIGLPAAGGAILATIAFLLPAGYFETPSTFAAGKHDDVTFAMLTSAAPQPNHKPTDPSSKAGAKSTATPASGARQRGVIAQAAMPASDHPAAAVAMGNDAAPAAASEDTSTMPPTPGGKQDEKSNSRAPTPEQQQQDSSEGAHHQQSTPSAASSSSSQSDSKNGNAKDSSGAGNQSSQSKQDGGDKSDSSDGGSPNGSPQSDSSPDSQGPSQGGQQQGSNGSQGSDSPGQGNGRSSMSSDEAGGSGQSSGANPPKKARGVAPLMLGTKQADLLQGRQLPGPDQRTRIQMPPTPQPLDPAGSATAAQRTADEPATGVYHVPADQLDRVDSYFQRFHQDAAKQ